jgi:two-component SAPR family response regulator
MFDPRSHPLHQRRSDQGERANSKMPRSLEGVRVLAVGDDYLVAQLINGILTDVGCVVLGPLPRLTVALDAAVNEAFDLAMLDINLGGEFVYPVAAILATRKIPFLFVTGYSVKAIPPEYADRPRIGKPFKLEQLISAVVNLV